MKRRTRWQAAMVEVDAARRALREEVEALKRAALDSRAPFHGNN
jgi:hypothetical protein